MDYQKQMLALHLKANPKEVLVGWYATSAELNTFSALIQNFYGGQGDGTFPHPAVHLTISTDAGKEIEARTYISAPVGVTAERAADSAAFVPVPHEIKYGEAEKGGLDLISGAKDQTDRTAAVLTDIEALERAIEEVLGLLERVSKYVEAVIEEEEETPSSALGQFLLNALALAPKVDPEDIERNLYVHALMTRSSPFRLHKIPNNSLEGVLFSVLLIPCNCSNNHIQDVLVVSYLANTIRTQIDLSNRLATAALTIGSGDAIAGGQTNGTAEGGNQRSGQRERGGGGRGR